jgi:Fur family ferric uptake transcriptional regulator
MQTSGPQNGPASGQSSGTASGADSGTTSGTARRLPCGRISPRAAHGEDSDLEVAPQLERLEEYIKGEGLKRSEQRAKIVELILTTQKSKPGHFGVQELVQRIQAVEPSIGAATVYRNVNLLCDAGILQETLTDETGQTLYEVAESGHHDHIVCLTCGEIFEFHDEAIETAQDRVARKLSFKPARHSHIIYADCEFKSR